MVTEEQKAKIAEARSRIEEKLQKAYAAIGEAQEISTETGVPFQFGVTYGAGAWFYPEDVDKTNDYGDSSDGWTASSQTC